MKRNILAGVLVVTSLCAAGWTGFGQRGTTPQVTYEYQVIRDPTEERSMEEGARKLNELGAQGWALVGIKHDYTATAPTLLYLMRTHR